MVLALRERFGRALLEPDTTDHALHHSATSTVAPSFFKIFIHNL